MKSKLSLTEFEIRDIKKLCWGNLGEFYLRYQEVLKMSKPWFYCIMQGKETKEDKIANIRKVWDNITTINHSDLKGVFDLLVEMVQKFSASHNIEDWLEIEKWMNKYGTVFKELY
jgi:hypothetical protein